tara:strand:+ start:2976 stop:3353 length:378 start_codon:yes stop_codon:yes gene_type:complete
LNPELKILFINGIESFNQKKYYDAHEYFEEMWIDYKLEDKLFIQALLQLSVAYFHISNSNKNGAIGLFKKSISKLDTYLDTCQDISNINSVIKSAHESYQSIIENENIHEFDWSLAPVLESKVKL